MALTKQTQKLVYINEFVKDANKKPVTRSQNDKTYNRTLTKLVIDVL